LEEKEDKLCVKILKTLQEMMAIDLDYGEKVNPLIFVVFYRSMLLIHKSQNWNDYILSITLLLKIGRCS